MPYRYGNGRTPLLISCESCPKDGSYALAELGNDFVFECLRGHRHPLSYVVTRCTKHGHDLTLFRDLLFHCPGGRFGLGSHTLPIPNWDGYPAPKQYRV